DPLQILKVAFSMGGNEGMRFKPNIPRYMAPSIVPLMRWSRPVPVAEKQPQSIMFPPPCLTVGMVFLGSYSAFFPLQTRVANGFLGDCGPSCLEITHKLPLCSSGVILHLSDDHRYRTRGYLAWNPRPRAMDSCLVLLPFTNNRTNSCLLLTKLLADGFVTHSSLVQVYNLISDVLGQLFGLAHGGEVEGVKYDSLDRFLLYTSPVEIRCTLLGLMRTNLCASWAHNWSVEARILASW